MNATRTFSSRIWYGAAALIMALTLLMPLLAGAAQVSERSITLSNASAAATNVSYGITFTPAEAGAGAFTVEFCDNSPLIGYTCNAPTGFTAASAATSTVGYTISNRTANRIVVGATLTEGTPVNLTVTGINNPTDAGPMYARIVTFEDTTVATASTATAPTGAIDEGGVALAITPTIGVSGTVLETLTFCVSAAAITDACQTTTDPFLELGELNGTVRALTPGVVSEGSIYTQISTNASGGAVIRLKSTAVGCGGLLRFGAPNDCDIQPALDGDISAVANEAKFGLKTTTATNTPGATNPTGALQPVSGSNYNNTTFALNFDDEETTGVTSPFGDPFLDTAGGPVTDKNMEIIFGATVANDTPAGTYSTDLSLIAVGKF